MISVGKINVWRYAVNVAFKEAISTHPKDVSVLDPFYFARSRS
jgi:hypothetical protein